MAISLKKFITKDEFFSEGSCRFCSEGQGIYLVEGKPEGTYFVCNSHKQKNPVDNEDLKNITPTEV